MMQQTTHHKFVEGRHQTRLQVPSIAMLIEADSLSSSSRSESSSTLSSSSRQNGGGMVTGGSSIPLSSMPSSDDDVTSLLSLRAPSTSTASTTSTTIMATTATTTMDHGGKDQAKTRSRERNRIHARKTRQRKKALMESLTSKAEGLKQEQIRIRQSINEKNTASILCQLFSKNSTSAAPGQPQPPSQEQPQQEQQQLVDPRIEALLRRPSEEIPDASKVPELPALILPGQHHSHLKKNEASTEEEVRITPAADDGIDYELLGKDRAQCTPAELDQIRRERNRMHAKRTRDRKRLFMEEMTDVCKQLEEENAVLQAHLDGLNGITSTCSPSGSRQAVAAVPAATAVTGFAYRPPLPSPLSATSAVSPAVAPVAQQSSGVTLDQIHTLLLAAGAFFPTSGNSAVSASSVSSSDEDNHDDERHHHHQHATGHDCASPTKRRRLSSFSEVSNRKPAPTGFRGAPIGT